MAKSCKSKSKNVAAKGRTQNKKITRGIRNQKPETHDWKMGQGDTGTQGKNKTDEMTNREGKTGI